ncbi:MAG: MFS transporter [Spirochaetes bacterium]|nr:MFS transporter [Spirochaetota bacterium]
MKKTGTQRSGKKNIIDLKLILRTLQYRNYRLFFIGQGLSLIGTWIQRIALSWLVYRMTGSAFFLGLVGFSSQLPSFLLSPFAGALADRLNKYRLIIITQAVAMLQAFILAWAVLTHSIAVWSIIVLSILLGFINAFDIPVRQSFVVELIGRREDLGNAIALNSAMFNVARLLGPGLAGIMINSVGEGVCFLINAISFIAVLISLFLMKIPYHKIKQKTGNILHEIKDGLRYAYHFEPIRYILIFLSIMSLVGMSYVVLMPVYVKELLHSGPEIFGILMSSSGIGALLGAIYLASRKSVLGLGKKITYSAAIMGGGLILLSQVHVLWVAMIMLFIIGLGMMVQMASSNTVLQTIVSDEKRGRVMSFYTMAFMGTAPFGSLMAGSLAGKLGAPSALILGGAACILSAIWFLKKLPVLRKKVRPIYVEKGILPQVASGIGTASNLTRPPEM